MKRIIQFLLNNGFKTKDNEEYYKDNKVVFVEKFGREYFITLSNEVGTILDTQTEVITLIKEEYKL